MSGKAQPDINDTLRAEGPGAVRARHDRARKYNSGEQHDLAFDPRFRLQVFEAITMTKEANYLVKGIIPRAGFAVVWGPPKCGKSFWTFDLTMHIALGREYRGRRVQEGPVVYLALEGGPGFHNRVEAWRRRYLGGHRGSVPFYLLDVPVDLIADRDKLVTAIKAQLGARIPVAVTIDTLNRALIGDENKSDDMAKFIRAADIIREAFGCAVIIVHHCGVAGSRPRGHTSLSGADDAQIAVERDGDGIITVKVEHMKDGDAAEPMASKLERIELGNDTDGDLITSCVVVPVEGVIAGSRKKLPGKAQLALKTLNDCLMDQGKPASIAAESDRARVPKDVFCVPLEAWRECLLRCNLINREGNYREEFKRLRVTLETAGKIGVWEGFVWAVT
jgi:AAA domain